MLSSASVFTVATQDAAEVVRQNVRNKWGHCNFTEWDETKFLDCFQLMDDLVKTLNLADDQEKKLLEQLKEWKGACCRMSHTMRSQFQLTLFILSVLCILQFYAGLM